MLMEQGGFMDRIIIAALSENGVIGKNGEMPWHIPEDLKRFRKLTLGNPILMGHNTYDSIGRPLPKRKNIVLSRNKELEIIGGDVVGNLEEALGLCNQSDKIYCIGGAQIYREFLPYATHLELTRIHKVVEGDTYFPDIDFNEWNLRNEENLGEYSFLSYEKVYKE